MVVRNVVKIVVAVAEAFGKALKRSWTQELSASKQASARSSAASGSSSTRADEETKANRRHGITLQESMQILNIKALDREEAEERFEHLFEINEKNKGGSQYLQRKIKAAKVRVDDELSKSAESKSAN